MDLSLLFFLPFAKQTKLKFDQDFPARWSLCFELKVLTESVVSLAMFSRFFEHSSLSWFYSTWKLGDEAAAKEMPLKFSLKQ